MPEQPVGTVEIARALPTEKHIVGQLLQLYEYDFSEFDGADADENGLFPDDYLAIFFGEENRHAYLVRVGDKLAGFALLTLDTREDGTRYTFMAEFFVMKKYRGQGIGQAVAHDLFARYPGDWEVSQIPENLPAQAFWRKIIGRYTDGQFSEETMDDGTVVQTFTRQQ